MSQFVWLDYSEHERRKMLDIVDLFREHDTRDELGVGSVRHTFADLFFPGTSTIMTRARYFLLVAWIYHRLEKQRINSAQFEERARRAETDLIDVIEQSDDSEGNIVGQLAWNCSQAVAEQYLLARARCLGDSDLRRIAGTVSSKPRSALCAAQSARCPTFRTRQ